MGTERNVSFEDNYEMSKRKHLARDIKKYNLVSITSYWRGPRKFCLYLQSKGQSSFIQSLNTYLLSAYYGGGTRNIVGRQAHKAPLLGTFSLNAQHIFEYSP